MDKTILLGRSPYEAPEVECIEVRIECAFATGGISEGGGNDDEDEY